MARIQVTLPETFIFTTELQVRVSDLNYGAHVGNDAILTLMQEARVILYRALGFKDEISFDDSIGQIISDAAIQYKSEAFLGDKLTIHIAVDEFTRFGFDMYYLIENTTTGKEVARGKTGIVCFDYDKRKVAAIPAVLLEKLQSL
ncbi:MAG TPA: thioesterase family protein [Ohtaekwangia sp.]|uniref:acyl-CoA thioesterase n=1 Tax=Ohtaekwangia sp. TaxID=2066019 RepID=UPI002F951419